jgi:hypothetical protein
VARLVDSTQLFKMGHGYNHYYDCDCPWCINYKKGKSKVQKLQEQIEFDKRINILNEYFSTTYPNARCYKCDATIFFYTNSYGSRVFFNSLGKPWPKHECYYENYGGPFDYEIDLNIENLPQLNIDNNEPATLLFQVAPKIQNHLLNGYIEINFTDEKTKIKNFIIKFDKREFGLCFYNETEKTIDCFINDESFSIKCLTVEEAKSLPIEIFPYEIGQITTIELFRDNIDREKVEVFYYKKVKQFIKRPLAYMLLKNMKETTLHSLEKSGRNGILVKVVSKLDKKNQIEFTEVE